MGTNSISNLPAYILFFTVSSSFYETNQTGNLASISSIISEPQPFNQEISEKRDLALDIHKFESILGEKEKLKVIYEFSDTIISKSMDIEPLIIEMVNENFWDLI